MRSQAASGPGKASGARSISPGRRQLGLDPGFGRLGWAVVEEKSSNWTLLGVGCIETAKTLAFEQRLLAIQAGVQDLCRQWSPQECAMETLFFSKNVKTAMQVAEARGVLRVTLAAEGIPVFEVAPSAVKLALAGSGSADKAQVGRMVVRLLNLNALPKPDDAADAVAIAVTGLRSAPMRKLQAALKGKR